MDNDGYPEDEDLEYIEQFDVIKHNVFNLIEYIQQIWYFGEDYCPLKKGKEKAIWELHTGGWSGNEDIVNALFNNKLFIAMFWLESRRGGHFKFEISKRYYKNGKNNSK